MLWLKILNVDGEIGFIPLQNVTYFEFEVSENNEPIIRIFVKELGDIAVKSVIVISGDKVLTAINDYLF